MPWEFTFIYWAKGSFVTFWVDVYKVRAPRDYIPINSNQLLLVHSKYKAILKG